MLNLATKSNFTVVLFFILILTTSLKTYADYPLRPCNTMSFSEQEEKKRLSDAAYDAAYENNLQESLGLYHQIFNKCNDDATVEFNFARVYQKLNNCSMAYYHFERLKKMRISDEELLDALNAEYSKVKAQCGTAVNVEITCEDKDDKKITIDIPALEILEAPCPFYGKLMPGEYPINITIPDAPVKREFLSVQAGEKLAKLKVNEFIPPEQMGSLKVICPKGQKKFTLSSGDGFNKSYPCPWIGSIKAGTYEIYIEGTERAATQSTINVVAQQQLDHYIINIKDKKTRCSTNIFTKNQSNSTFFFLLSLLIMAFLRLLPLKIKN